MRLLGHVEDQVDLRVGFDELMLLRTTLFEMCNGMHFTENDFQTILGTSRAEAEALLRRMDGVLDRLGMSAEHD
jgi:hypothetical protein